MQADGGVLHKTRQVMHFKVAADLLFGDGKPLVSHRGTFGLSVSDGLFVGEITFGVRNQAFWGLVGLSLRKDGR